MSEQQRRLANDPAANTLLFSGQTSALSSSDSAKQHTPPIINSKSNVIFTSKRRRTPNSRSTHNALWRVQGHLQHTRILSCIRKHALSSVQRPIMRCERIRSDPGSLCAESEPKDRVVGAPSVRDERLKTVEIMRRMGTDRGK